MKKLTTAQQKVIDIVKAGMDKFAGKTYEEVYSRKEDRTSYTKYVYGMAQRGFILVYGQKATFDALTKRGLIETEGGYSFGSQFVKLVTKAEAIEAMDDDAEDPSVTLDEFIAKAQEIDNMKEDEPMTAQIGDKVKIGATTYTIAEIFYAQLFQSRFPAPDDGWMIEFKDTNGGYHYWKQYLDGGEFIKATADNNTTTNNEEEEIMNTTTTNTVTYHG